VDLRTTIIKTLLGEKVEIAEDTMTHITLGPKVKNQNGGHDQKVHYKGEHIGSIGSYKHHGLRWGAMDKNGEAISAGFSSPEECISDLRHNHAYDIKNGR